VLPNEQDLAIMGQFNEEMLKRVAEIGVRQMFELEDFPKVPDNVAELQKKVDARQR
jgi:hypothetical protein